jgi:hypothetical protein
LCPELWPQTLLRRSNFRVFVKQKMHRQNCIDAMLGRPVHDDAGLLGTSQEFASRVYTMDLSVGKEAPLSSSSTASLSNPDKARGRLMPRPSLGGAQHVLALAVVALKLASCSYKQANHRARPFIAETNRICMVLFSMNNKVFGPCLAAIHRISISGMPWSAGDQFALFESVVALAMLVRRYEFEPAPDAPPVGMTTGATIHTSEGLLVVLKPRCAQVSCCARQVDATPPKCPRPLSGPWV